MPFQLRCLRYVAVIVEDLAGSACAKKSCDKNLRVQSTC